MNFAQIGFLALIQGAAELLPVSSSAHVIVAEKLMGLDPSAPEMTFLLVMLHTGTMFAVIFYFWSRWKKFSMDFLKKVVVATAVTGCIGFGLKKGIEKLILVPLLGESKAEIEQLFKSLPMIAAALMMVGILIIIADFFQKKSKNATTTIEIKNSVWIGAVQGLCLPFRGFSRSGATISTAMLGGISRSVAEDFSFALAVVLTPPVIGLQLVRLLKAVHGEGGTVASAPVFWSDLLPLLLPGLMGMVLSFISGFLALRWLSSWLEGGRWKYFGFYCIFASCVVIALQLFWF